MPASSPLSPGVRGLLSCDRRLPALPASSRALPRARVPLVHAARVLGACALPRSFSCALRFPWPSSLCPPADGGLTLLASAALPRAAPARPPQRVHAPPGRPSRALRAPRDPLPRVLLLPV